MPHRTVPMTSRVEVDLNDYSKLNRAIAIESDKYRSQMHLFQSQTFLFVCSGLAAAALGLALAYYIYRAALAVPEVRYIDDVSKVVSARDIETSPPESMQSTPEENRDIRSDLQHLESRDETTIEEVVQDILVPPEKQYTAFTHVTTETGETITTGRTFTAGLWDKPSSQYCYLDLPGIVGGTPMAHTIEDGSLVVTTDDTDLIRFAKEYCRFELTP